MSVLLLGLSPLWGSMGLVTRSPYCGGSSSTWREVTSSDGRRRAVKDELGIGGTAKKWALIGGWRPPGGGRRFNEVGPLMRVSFPWYIPYWICLVVILGQEIYVKKCRKIVFGWRDKNSVLGTGEGVKCT